MMDNRGQPIGILRYFAALIFGAPLAYFVYRVTNPILDMAGDSSQGTAAADATGWFTTANEYLIFAFLLISFFGLIVLALYQRQVRV